MEPKDAKEICFDGWTLRVRSGELLRNGACTRLQEKPLQLLELLLTHPGEVVTREQLISHLWPNGVVDFDTGINTAVRKLRIALSDDREMPRYIETIPRRGYRFIGKIEPEAKRQDTDGESAVGIGAPDAPPTAVAKPKPRWIASVLAVLVIGLGAIGVMTYNTLRPASREVAPSIVVLPFVDMGAAKQDEFFCDGLTEELSNWLSQLPGLRVVSRTTAFKYKGKSIDARQVGKELSVTHVLEGSIQRVGNQARVTAQLINASDGYHLWSKSFDMPLINILQVEDSVSRSVAEAMQVRLLPDISLRWAARRPEGAEALEQYLIARHYYRQRTTDDSRLARDYYRRAITADNKFALAYIGLAEVEINEIAVSGRAVREVVDKAEPLLAQATALNPALPELFAVRGWLLTVRNELHDAEAALAKAIELNPSDAASHRYLGEIYRRRAQPRDEAEQYRLAIRLDPLDFVPHIRLCLTLQALRNFQEATEACAQAKKIEPDNYWNTLTESWLARSQGFIDEAYLVVAAAVRRSPTVQPLINEFGDIELLLGLTDDARKMYESHPVADKVAQQLRMADVSAASFDNDRLHAILQEIDTESIESISQLVKIMRLQFAAGDDAATLRTLTKIKSNAEFSPAYLLDADQVRNDYSAAFYCGAVDFLIGDRAQGERLLDELADLLNRMETNGAHWYGLYSLRAQALAVRGDQAGAMSALRRSAELGWRLSRQAQREPYLRPLTTRSDYRELIADVENKISTMRADVQRQTPRG